VDPVGTVKKPYLLALAGYFAITVLMTYPLVTVFSTHVPGSGGDDQQFIWNFWWAKHSLMELGQSPLYTEHQIIPFRSALAMHTYIFLNSLLSVPLQYFMGIVAINNLLLMVSFIFTGFGTFLLVWHLVGDSRAAFVSGAIFSFCSYKMLVLGGHYNIVMSHWLPFYVLFLIKALWEDGHSLRNAVFAGIIFGLNYLTSMTYAIFAAMLTALLIFYIAAARRDRFIAAIKAAALTVLVSLPFVLPHLLSALNTPTDIEALGEWIGKSWDYADLLSFIIPPAGNPVYGGLARGMAGQISIGSAFMGYTVLALLVLGLREAGLKGEWVKLFLVSFLFFLLLSMGRSLHVMGHDLGLPLPFALMMKAPKLTNMRVPVRFIIPAMLCLSIICAYGVVRLNKRARFLWVAVIALVLADGMVVQQVFDSRVPQGYEIIASDKESDSIIELPLFVRSGNGYIGRTFMPTINYQRAHGKRIFGGFLSRLSSLKMMFGYLNLPLLRAFILLESGYDVPVSAMEDEKALASEVIGLFEVGHVVIHKKETGVSKAFVSALTGAETVYEDDETVIMRIALKREYARKTIYAGKLSSIPYFFKGWFNGLGKDKAAYALSSADSSVILLNLVPEKAYTLSLASFALPDAKGVKVSAYVNEQLIGDFSPQEKVKSYSFDIEPGIAVDGVDRLRLVYDRTFVSSRPFNSLPGPETTVGKWPGGSPDIDTGPNVTATGKAGEIMPWEHSLAEYEKARLSIGIVTIDIEQLWQGQRPEQNLAPQKG
jgi:hypothetical protein